VIDAEYEEQFRMVSTTDRHRMAKEIAEELLDQQKGWTGSDPYVYALEKLANGTQQPKLWRDVLSYLDEFRLTKGE
jgi:hypothetical protein